MRNFKNNAIVGAIISFLVVICLFSLSIEAQAETIPKGPEYVYGTVNNNTDSNYLFWYSLDENDVVTKGYTRIVKINGSGVSFAYMNALGVRDDGFYVKSNTGTTMQYIDWNGVVQREWNATGLAGSARAGAFTSDGKYITTSDIASSEGKLNIYIYDVDARTLVSKTPMTNSTSLPISDFYAMGDAVADDNGFLYAVVSNDATTNRKVRMLKIKIATGEIVDVLPIPKLDHSPAVAFMSDGRLLVSDQNNLGAIVSFEEGTVVYTDKKGTNLPNMGGSVTLVTDFASLNFPKYNTELSIVAQAPLTANYRETIQYKFSVRNTGNIMSLQTKVKETLSPYVEYVPNTTAVNGVPVADINGTSPILTTSGLTVNSPDSESAVLVSNEENPSHNDAVATFSVKIKDEGDLSQSIRIQNLGIVYNPEEMKTSNMTYTDVGPFPSSVTVNFLDDANLPIQLAGVEPVVKNYLTGESADLTQNADVKRTLDIIKASGKYEPELIRPTNENGVLITKDGTQVSYIFTRIKRNLTVNFVNEEGEPVDDPFVLNLPIDTSINVGENPTVRQKLATLEANHYELLKRPDNEAVTIGMEDSSVEYVFKETLGRVQVIFVNEEQKPISDPITIKGVIESEVILTENEAIKKTIADLKEKHYEFVTGLEKVTIEKTAKTISYEFKGMLYIESFPSKMNFGDNYLIRPHIKAEQPKYDVPLIVGDNRVTKTPWTLTATLEDSLRSVDSPSEDLPRALTYKVSDTEKFYLRKGEAQPIETGSGGYNVSEKWITDQTGLQIEVFSNEVIQKGSYRTSILWQVGVTP